MTTTPIHHVPCGLPAVVTQLVVADARALVAWAERTFGAELAYAAPNPDGRGIMHGVLHVAGVPIFIADANAYAQATQGNTFVYVPDAAATATRAAEAGGRIVVPVADMFWGDRWGAVVDPFGNLWQIATHVEDVAPDEMQRRMAAMAVA